MFDRWRKLVKAFYSEKKGQFDISKVPDIYDAAKYDSIHNTHLELTQLQDVYEIAKVLAAAVIPNEYGIQPVGKLRIGSTICAQLLGKLLADLASMREESMATAGVQQPAFAAETTAAAEDKKEKSPTAAPTNSADISPSALRKLHTRNAGAEGTTNTNDGGGFGGKDENNIIDPGLESKSNQQLDEGIRTTEGGTDTSDPDGSSPSLSHLSNAAAEIEAEVPVGGEDDEGDDAVLHRLCPTYAQDINSPLRHVRTRIYFTSESHCHSLINVLRFCQLGLGPGAQGLLSEVGQQVVRKSRELDYMTHVVFRMFENKTLPLDNPGRFKVEILFSPGAAHDPYEVVPLRKDHVIPIVPRSLIHDGGKKKDVQLFNI